MMFFHNFGSVDMKGGGGGGVFDDGYGQEHKGVASKFQNDHHHLLHHQQQKRECHSDEDDSSRSSGGGGGAPSADNNQLKKPKRSPSAPAPGDDATIEVSKRPRGRPPGSKNKPKPPVVITRDADPSSAAAMRPHILEIPAGHDVVDSLSRFSLSRNVGLCVLAGTGVVSNVTLRQPSPASASPAPPPGSTVTFHGRFEILSISATFFPPSFAPPSPSSHLFGAGAGGFSISLAGPQGQVVGGAVAGSLLAAGTVTVVAATFSDPTYHRLPAEDDVYVSVSVSVSGGGGGGDVDTGHPHAHHQQQQQQQPHQQHHHLAVSSPTAASTVATTAPPPQHRHHHHAAATSTFPSKNHHAAATAPEPSGLSIYSCHRPSDVIWPPSTRPPPPY